MNVSERKLSNSHIIKNISHLNDDANIQKMTFTPSQMVSYDHFSREIVLTSSAQFAKTKNLSHKYINQEHDYNTKLDMDIYFNKKGAERIKKTDHDKIAKYYLSLRIKLEKEHNEHPVLDRDEKKQLFCKNIFNRYHMFRYTHNFIKTSQCDDQAMKKLSADYTHAFGRELAPDYKAYKKAQNFAVLTHKLLEQKQENYKIASFFSSLSKARLSYNQGIITLAKIAGLDNMRVYNLSGPGEEIARIINLISKK